MVTERKKEFARVLKEARGSRSQAWLARAVGISQKSVSEYEDEDAKTLPKPAMVVGLAQALGSDAKEWLAIAGCNEQDFPESALMVINGANLNIDRIMTEDDMEFLFRQQKLFHPFTIRFALDLLARRRDKNVQR